MWHLEITTLTAECEAGCVLLHWCSEQEDRTWNMHFVAHIQYRWRSVIVMRRRENSSQCSFTLVKPEVGLPILTAYTLGSCWHGTGHYRHTERISRLLLLGSLYRQPASYGSQGPQGSCCEPHRLVGYNTGPIMQLFQTPTCDTTGS